MKTGLSFRQLVMFVALLLGFFISSCTKEEQIKVSEAANQENLHLKNAALPTAHTVDVFCDLIAGQTISVGQLVTSHDNTYLYVTYLTTSGWTLSEVHFYIGTMAIFKETCMNKKAIQVGHFPYSKTGLNVTQFKITIELSTLPTMPADGYAVFAHAIVKNGNQEETAWSNGCAYKPLITVKSWFKNNVNSSNSWWAASSGSRFSNNPLDWCYHLGTNIYSGTDTYSFESDRASVVNPGHIDVSDNGTQLLVDVNANTEDGYKLAQTYIYIGNMEGLQGYVSGNCPNYYNFPDKKLNEADVHRFIFPLTILENKFFSTISANRWGWFFYYPF